MRTPQLLAAFAAIVLSTSLSAHDGHAHKVMGTVTNRDAKRIELKTPGGEVLSIAVNEKTIVTRNKKKVAFADVQKGLRAVVDIGNGEDPLIARGIELGATKIAEQ
jgi:hypothetical protein